MVFFRFSFVCICFFYFSYIVVGQQDITTIFFLLHSYLGANEVEIISLSLALYSPFSKVEKISLSLSIDSSLHFTLSTWDVHMGETQFITFCNHFLYCAALCCQLIFSHPNGQLQLPLLPSTLLDQRLQCHLNVHYNED